MEVENEQQQSRPLNVGSGKWYDNDIADLQVLFDRVQWTENFVTELRSEALQAPELLPEDMQDSLGSIPTYRKQIDLTKQSWLSRVAHNRSAFASVAFEFNCIDGIKFYKFMFALQQLVFVATSRLQKKIPQYATCRQLKSGSYSYGISDL